MQIGLLNPKIDFPLKWTTDKSRRPGSRPIKKCESEFVLYVLKNEKSMTHCVKS